MFYSKKLNILFIASPKTGSRSVEKFLSAIDPNGEKHGITLEDRVISSQDMKYGVVGHARAFELKNALGDEIYNSLNSFGFVRHPFNKLVSTYFFNKKGSLGDAFKTKGEKKRAFRALKTFFTFFFPKILPFHLWALLFPMKTNKEYFLDKKEKTIVKHLGRTEFLNEDLKLICKLCNIDTHDIEIPHINTSNHKNWKHYFKNKSFFKIMSYKYRKELSFYREIELSIEAMRRNELVK